MANKNEHLIPVVVLDMIEAWKNAIPNSFERNNIQDRLIAIQEKITSEIGKLDGHRTRK